MAKLIALVIMDRQKKPCPKKLELLAPISYVFHKPFLIKPSKNCNFYTHFAFHISDKLWFMWSNCEITHFCLPYYFQGINNIRCITFYKYWTEAAETCVHISSLIILQSWSILFRFFCNLYTFQRGIVYILDPNFEINLQLNKQRS